MRPIVLIGPMGAGKTTLGKKLAKKLSLPFTDTDKEIEREHGSVTQIFASHGEHYFRDLEHNALKRALETGGVIATGGGIVLRRENRELLAESLVILLDTNKTSVLSRVNVDKRPLLKDDPENWQRIYDDRIELYQGLADEVLFTGNRPIRDLLGELESRVSTHEL